MTKRIIFPSIWGDFESVDYCYPKSQHNVTESETHYSIEIELPGVSQENVEIGVKGKVLSVLAKRFGELSNDGSANLISEYNQSFNLGDGLDLDGIDAILRCGILTLRIPKSDVKYERTIAIRA